MAFQSSDQGAFVPSTFIINIGELQEMDVASNEFKDFLVRLFQNFNALQLNLNLKDTALYNTEEFVNGQLFFPDPDAKAGTPAVMDGRQVFRKVINFGGLPNNATTSVAHNINITSAYTFTRLYGAASDPVSLKYIPIPNASADINLEVDVTNVNIKTTTDLTAYTTAYAVLEYLKQ